MTILIKDFLKGFIYGILILGPLTLFLILLSGCGTDDRCDKRQVTTGGVPFDQSLPYIVRARAVYDVEVSDGELYLVPKASGSVPVSSVVAANVKFTLDTANFVPPTAPEDQLESYGSLDLTQLRDNNLDVCGGGSTQCSTGVIQIYTSGANEGLYNAAKGISLPIYTGVTEVGLGQGSAVVLDTESVSTKNVLRLNHFTGGGDMVIPISVDFLEAAAGSYSATIVVEYILQ